MAELHLNYPNIQDEKGQLHSIADPSLYLTFGIWIYLVPQYKPKSVLMLGYGGGTAAKLIRMFYGDVPITAVDFSDVSEFLIDGVEWINADAKEWVYKTEQKYDAVIVDLYDTDDFHPPEFVLSKEFAKRLGEISNYIILHTVVGDDTSAYDFNEIRCLNLGRTDPYAPEVHYYMVNEVPIPVR